jgi:anti-sigma regulatory factor (Ser/Thr protein kinase)
VTAGKRNIEPVEDLSLHILDIAENSIRADATKIEIIITADTSKDLLRIEINDDGRGMDAETLARVHDPFFTTKHKKTGLGIPLLAQAAEQAGGNVLIDSSPGKGTKVVATFQRGHVDRPPIGNMTETVMTLIAGHPDRDYIYEEREDNSVFRIDTRELKADLGDVPITEFAVLNAIRNELKEHSKLR